MACVGGRFRRAVAKLRLAKPLGWAKDLSGSRSFIDGAMISAAKVKKEEEEASLCRQRK